MNESELAKFIHQHSAPQMTDIEMARRVILEYLGAQGTTYIESERVLIPLVQQSLVKGRDRIPAFSLLHGGFSLQYKTRCQSGIMQAPISMGVVS